MGISLSPTLLRIPRHCNPSSDSLQKHCTCLAQPLTVSQNLATALALPATSRARTMESSIQERCHVHDEEFDQSPLRHGSRGLLVGADSKRRREVDGPGPGQPPTSSSYSADQDDPVETGPVRRQPRGLLRAYQFRDNPHVQHQ